MNVSSLAARAAVAVFTVAALSATAHAQWLAPANDGSRALMIPGAGDLELPTVGWSLPTGQFATGGSFVFTDIGGDELGVVVANQGSLVARDLEDRVVWSTANLGINTIVGSWDFDGDDDAELLVMAASQPGALFLVDEGSGAILWQKNDFAFTVTPSYLTLIVEDMTGDGVVDIIFAAQGSPDLELFSFADGFGSTESEWTTPIVGYRTILWPIVGDFLDGEGDEILLMQSRNYRVYDGQDGTEEMVGPVVMSQTAFGHLQTVADLDDDGLEEVASVSWSGPNGRHIGVLSVDDGSWVWQYEYTGDVRIEPVAEAIADVDGDGELELVANLWDSTSDEFEGFPRGPAGNYDGIDNADTWTVGVFDLATGDLEVAIADRFVRAVTDLTGDGVADIVAHDATGAPNNKNFFADIIVTTVAEDGSTVDVLTLEDADVLRVQAPRVGDQNTMNGGGALVHFGDDIIVALAIADDGSPSSYARIGAEDGTAAVLAEVDVTPERPFSLWLPPSGDRIATFSPRDGAQLHDGTFAATTGTVTTSGRLVNPLVSETQLAFLVDDQLRVYDTVEDPASAPELAWSFSRLGLADLFGAVVGEDAVWLARARTADGNTTALSLSETGTLNWEYASGVANSNSSRFVVEPAEGLIYLTLFDPSLAGAERFYTDLLDAVTGDMVASAPNSLGRTFTDPGVIVTGRDDGARLATATINRLHILGDDGTLELEILNRGLNNNLVAWDVDGDGVQDLIAFRARDLATDPYAVCAYSGDDGATLWCNVPREAVETLNSAVAPIPRDGGGSDLAHVIRYGEVRRVSGVDGTSIWSRCLSGGDLFVHPTDPTEPFAAPCPAASLSAPVTADIDGDDDLEIVIGSGDGYLYVLGIDGSLERATNLRAAVGRPIITDANGDGTLDLFAPLGTGSLVSVLQAESTPVAEVLDVSFDADTGTFGVADINETFTFFEASVRWTAIAGGREYRVQLIDENGASIASTVVTDAAATTHRFEDLRLQIGSTYQFGVIAVTEAGAVSVEVISDGFTVTDPGAPIVSGVALDPELFAAGDPVLATLMGNAASRAGIDSYTVSFMGEEVFAAEGFGRENLLMDAALPELTGAGGAALDIGEYEVTVTVIDGLDREATATATFAVVDEPVIQSATLTPDRFAAGRTITTLVEATAASPAGVTDYMITFDGVELATGTLAGGSPESIEVELTNLRDAEGGTLDIGDYEIEVAFVDGLDRMVTTTLPFSVLDEPMVADAAFDPSTFTEGTEVTGTLTATGTGSVNLVSWSVVFEGNEVASGDIDEPSTEFDLSVDLTQLERDGGAPFVVRTYDIEVFMTDELGRQATAIASFRVVAGPSGPSVEDLEIDPDSFVFGDGVQATVSGRIIAEAGLDAWVLALEGETVLSASGFDGEESVALEEAIEDADLGGELAPGEYTLELTATDVLGQVGTGTASFVVLDATADVAEPGMDAGTDAGIDAGADAGDAGGDGGSVGGGGGGGCNCSTTNEPTTGFGGLLLLGLMIGLRRRR